MTIWKTVECEAWSRGFDYRDYVDVLCRANNVKPLAESTYIMLCSAFEHQMWLDIGKGE